MSVDWTKPIQTEDGDPAELLASWDAPAPGLETRAVAVGGGLDKVVTLYFENGRYRLGHKCGDDIINVPPRKETRVVEAWAAVDHAGRVLYHGDLSIAETVMSQRKTAQLVRLTGTYEAEVAE